MRGRRVKFFHWKNSILWPKPEEEKTTNGGGSDLPGGHAAARGGGSLTLDLEGTRLEPTGP